MKAPAEPRHPWTRAFAVCNDDEHHAQDEPCTVCRGDIVLRQQSDKVFHLDSQVTYVDDIDLAPRSNRLDTDGNRTSGPLTKAEIADLVTVGPGEKTDLASIPGPLRWIVNTYGTHTPAALLHDKLITGPGTPEADRPSIADEEADRFFRVMLKAVGVSFVLRWVMWAAVALRTRWFGGAAKKATMIVWIVLSLAGLTAFAITSAMLIGDSGASWIEPVFWTSLVLPLFASMFWGMRLYLVGIIASLAIPFIVVPFVSVLVARFATWCANLLEETMRDSVASADAAVSPSRRGELI